MISKEYLQHVFEYRDGELIWKHCDFQRPQWNARHVGKTAGRVNSRGYKEVCFRPNQYNQLEKRRFMSVHRIIFLLHHGFLPDVIDHIDGDPSNNKIENLRAASAFHNQLNRKKSSNNTSGVSGVSYHKDSGKWEVRISNLGTRHRIGAYQSFSDAVIACESAKQLLNADWRRLTDRVVAS